MLVTGVRRVAGGARRCWTLMIQLSSLLGLMHLGDQSQKQQGCPGVFPEAGFISGHISMRSVRKKLPGGLSAAETWLRPRGGAREASGRDSAAGLQGHAEGGAPVHGQVSERGRPRLTGPRRPLEEEPGPGGAGQLVRRAEHASWKLQVV